MNSTNNPATIGSSGEGTVYNPPKQICVCMISDIARFAIAFLLIAIVGHKVNC